MAATIPALLKQCLKELTDITCSPELQRYESEVSHRSWLDELGRLRIWAGNIGAHQTGQSSLEYRLRDASHLKNETIRILQRILQGLESLSDLLNEPEEELEDEPYEEALSSDESEEPDDPEDDMTYAQVLHQSLRNTINLLFQMSMEIRRPGDHDRLLGTKIKDDIIASFELHSHRHVSEKFPGADSEIVGRLGSAMAQQRAVLKYREQHRKKLAHGLIEDLGLSEISETIATDSDLPVPCDSEGDELGFLETSSISAVTQTSYAPSMLAGGELLSVPKPPPESADESPFECPYCCLIITIKSMKDWARHIFRDLMPYVCLVPGCGTPSKLYESRRQWFNHMLSNHSAASPATSHGEFVCPLCSGNFQPPNTFERHVGHHLEQLTLFILPRDYAEEDDSPGGSDAVGSSSSIIVASDDDNASEIIDEHEIMPKSPIDTSSTHAENSHRDGLGDISSESLHQETKLDPRLWPTNTVSDEKDEDRDATMNDAELRPQEGSSVVVDAKEESEQSAREKQLAHDRAIEAAASEAAALARADYEERTRQDAARQMEREKHDRVIDEAAAAEAAAKATADAKKTVKEAAAKAIANAEEPAKRIAAEAKRNTAIKFKDAVGRKFLFPYDLCSIWQRMQELIKTAFLNIEVVGPIVAEGRYDLVGPNGDIILPQVWEKVIEPGWTITMHMWPIPMKLPGLPGNIKRTENGSLYNPGALLNYRQTSLTENLDGDLDFGELSMNLLSSNHYNPQDKVLNSPDHGHGAHSEDMTTQKSELDGLIYQVTEPMGPDEEMWLNDAHQSGSRDRKTPFDGPVGSRTTSHSPQNQTPRNFPDGENREDADHDATYPHGRRFRCRAPGCPREKIVFTLHSTFARHIETQHHPRMIYHCGLGSACGQQFTRRDKLTAHLRGSHLTDPRTVDIDGHKTDIECPIECYFCHSSTSSWPEFYRCFMRHCEVDNESETLDETGFLNQEPAWIDQHENPNLSQSKSASQNKETEFKELESTSRLNSAENIYLHPATMRQEFIEASLKAFNDKPSDDSNMQDGEAPAEPPISKHASSQDPVRTKRGLNTAAARKSRERKQAQAQSSEDRIKELEEQIARLSLRQVHHQAAQPASGSPRIQCRVPGCPSSDKIYQSRSSFQRHVESRHHPQARWFCSFEGCEREENSLEEVRFHCQTKHSQEPTGEARKIDLQCPPVCSLCSSPVADWAAFYKCYISHCVSQEVELTPAREAEGAESSSSRIVSGN